MSRSVVPNFFTVLNIFFGFLSMTFALQDQIVLAIWYILAGAICDALDGIMARLTNSASEFGVELDSLADVVSFGAAPSFVLYKLTLSSYGTAGPIVSALPLIFGALRLARFNVQLVGFSKSHFRGLPIPLAAMTMLSYIFFFTPQQIRSTPLLSDALLVLVIFLSLLMVSTVRYPIIPKLSKKSFRQHPLQMSFIVLGVVLIAITGLKALFPLLLSIVLYGAIKSALSSARTLFRKKDEAASDIIDPDSISHHHSSS